MASAARPTDAVILLRLQHGPASYVPVNVKQLIMNSPACPRRMKSNAAYPTALALELVGRRTSPPVVLAERLVQRQRHLHAQQVLQQMKPLQGSATRG